MKTLILAFFSLFLQGNGQINYNLNPFAGFQPLQPIRPLINRPDLQNGFGTKFERNKRSPQFHQNYQPGSQSQNFNCHFGGCGNIPGMQQFHGGYVTNQGSNFNQNYFGGSSATNFGRKKRSPQFLQNYAPGSQSQNFNCRFGGCGGIPGMQQFHGGYVHNTGGLFNQNYFAGSQSQNFNGYGRKKRETEVEEIKTDLESLPELTDPKNCFCKSNDVQDARQFFTYPSRPSKVRGTVHCTYPDGLPACKCMCEPFTIINPNPTYTSTSWPSYSQSYTSIRYYPQTWAFGRKKRETTEKTELIEEVIEVSDNPASMKCLCPTDQTYLRFPMTTQKIKMPGTVLCTYPGGKTSCKCTCKPFTIIEVDYTNLYPVVKRSANPQFIQNYQPGSQSQNFNCHFGGCGNIPGMQQFHGSHVINQGSNFNQDYFGGSHATNFGRKKRSPQFFQSFAPGSANVNCDAKGCGPAHLYPGTASLPTQFSNMMSNLNPFGQRPQQYPQQVQPGFMHFGDWPQFPQKPAAATIME